MSVIIPYCTECAHFLTENCLKEKPRCRAFPEGIPEKWFWYGNPRNATECNNGISFEPDEE